MKISPVLLVCFLAALSALSINGRCFEVELEDADDARGANVSVEAMRLPGSCWTCKWVLNKVKKAAGSEATEQVLTSLLSHVCDQIGFLKPLCHSMMRKHLSELVEELSTTDDVRTICVNIKACMPKRIFNHINV